jgi:DNA-binding transcriptional LysR family regulator
MQQMCSQLVSTLSMNDLRRLRAFHAVADSGSFSIAALELGYAQSVVSHHVATLEREVGVTLVNRGTRPVTLTDAGARLLRHTVNVLGHVRAAEDELRAVAGLERGTLRVGAFLSALNSFVPGALARFEASHPDIEIVLEQSEEPEALRRVRSGDLDMAVVWRDWQRESQPPHQRDEGLEEIRLADDHYRVVVPPGHRLARRRSVRLAELAGERFNGPPAEGFTLPYRNMLEQLCSEAGFEPDVAYVLRDITVARAFVAAGLCVALMPELTLPEPRADIVVLPVRDMDPFRTIYVTWLRGRRVPAVTKMAGYLVDTAAVGRAR